jgi:hypothetical protein
MPIRLWLKWMAWAKTQGPLGALGDDFRVMQLALAMAQPYLPEERRQLRTFIQPWRAPSDFRAWGIDLGEDPKPEEFDGADD